MIIPDHLQIEVQEKLRESIIIDDRKCWNWQKSKFRGYGSLRLFGKTILAHRASYLAFKGTIDENLCVLHRCDNRACINPEHLYTGTYADNMGDRLRRGSNANHFLANQTHCKHGHEFTPENTYIRKDGRGRQCKLCQQRLGKTFFSKRQEIF